MDPAALLAAGRGPVVLLEDPRHLGNVGAAVRVAAAAGADGVLTTGARDPWDPDGPAGLRRPALRAPGRPRRRAGARRRGRSWRSIPGGAPLEPGGLPERALLAFGTERHGLSDGLLARATLRVAIPMRPGVSSLNLATAVAVALYAGGLARPGG